MILKEISPATISSMFVFRNGWTLGPVSAHSNQRLAGIATRSLAPRWCLDPDTSIETGCDTRQSPQRLSQSCRPTARTVARATEVDRAIRDRRTRPAVSNDCQWSCFRRRLQRRSCTVPDGKPELWRASAEVRMLLDRPAGDRRITPAGPGPRLRADRELALASETEFPSRAHAVNTDGSQVISPWRAGRPRSHSPVCDLLRSPFSWVDGGRPTPIHPHQPPFAPMPEPARIPTLTPVMSPCAMWRGFFLCLTRRATWPGHKALRETAPADRRPAAPCPRSARRRAR